jgi:hypothetical protein
MTDLILAVVFLTGYSKERGARKLTGGRDD